MRITRRQLQRIVTEAKSQLTESVMSAEENAHSAIAELFDAYLTSGQDFDGSANQLRNFVEGYIEERNNYPEGF